MDERKVRSVMSRREFGVVSAAALASPLVGFASEEAPSNAPTAEPQIMQRPAGGAKQGLNILFIFGDQERYLAKWPKGPKEHSQRPSDKIRPLSQNMNLPSRLTII